MARSQIRSANTASSSMSPSIPPSRVADDPTSATVVDDLGRLGEAINRVVRRRVVSRRSIEVRGNSATDEIASETLSGQTDLLRILETYHG